MSYVRTKIEDDKRKNKPNIIFPIINTIIAVGVLIVVIILFATSHGEFPVSLFIFTIVLLILYPLGSWLNSFVLKKMNLRKINNYEKETEILIKYVRRYESYRAYDYPNDVKLHFSVELTDNISNVQTKYYVDSCNFGTPENSSILLTLGVSFAGIEVSRETGEMKRIAGVLPRSIWYNKHLKVPTSKKAKIKVDITGINPNQKMVIHTLKRADTYYDNKTGWIAVGERKITVIDDAYEISKDVIVVLRDQELMSVWIKVEPGLFVK